MALVEGSNEIEFVDRWTGLRTDRGRHVSGVVLAALPCWLHAPVASEQPALSSRAWGAFVSVAAAGGACPLDV